MRSCINTMIRACLEFLAHRGGNVSIIFGITLVPLLAFAGASIDYGRAVDSRSAIQSAADASALAAAGKYDADNNTRETIAKDMFAANLASVGIKAVVTPNVAFGAETATVTASLSIPTTLMAAININSIDVAVSATARRAPEIGPVCVLALSPSASEAISFEGGASLTATNCAAHTNSNAEDALAAVGSSSAVADDFCAVGRHKGSNFSTTPHANCTTAKDPFENLPAPVTAGCDFTGKVFTSGTHTASPGVYCGGIVAEAHAVVALNPGIYVIKDGPLELHSHSTISGSGIVFYLTGNGAILDIRSGSNLDLIAPMVGPYAGLVFVQDSTSSVGLTSLVEGGGTVRIVGGFYLPTQTLDIAGGGDIGALSPFMPIIASDMTFRGNAVVTVNVDHSIAGMPDFLPTVRAGTPMLIY